MIITVTLGVLLSLSLALNVWSIRKGAACMEHNEQLRLLKSLDGLHCAIMKSTIEAQQKHIEELEGKLNGTEKTCCGKTEGQPSA